MYNNEEILAIQASCQLVSQTLLEIKKYIRPGATLDYIDKIAENFIIKQGGKPAFKGYRGFPASLCLSVNEEVVHGIPTNRRLKTGDILSVDCGVELNGFFGDSAYTFCVGSIHQTIAKLIEITKESLYKGIAKAIAGNYTGDIGAAVEKHVTANGYSVVRHLVGHGVGRHLHEAPQVPNFGPAGQGELLVPGMVLAIEPMINWGDASVKQANDGWTIYAADRKPSAHFEHTVAITNDQPIILTTFDGLI